MKKNKGGSFINYSSLIKKVSREYGTPYESNIKKPSFNPFPSDHSFDENAIKKFIEACNPEIRDICIKIIKETDHISFENFVIRINATIYDLISKINIDRPLFIFLANKSEFSEIIEKSNYWLYIYITEYIKYITNNKITILLIDSLNYPEIEENDFIVFIDDCIYSGMQMGNTIMNLNKQDDKDLNLNMYFLVPFITNDGIEHILGTIDAIPNIRYSIIHFSKYLYKPKMTDDVLTRDEIRLLNKYYDNIIYFYDKALIYFDHKLADTRSTITPFYLGYVPSEINMKKEDFKIIPIIKNCSYYTTNINFDNPGCPAPPYKKKLFKSFVSKNKNKKINSLI